MCSTTNPMTCTFCRWILACCRELLRCHAQAIEIGLPASVTICDVLLQFQEFLARGFTDSGRRAKLLEVPPVLACRSSMRNRWSCILALGNALQVGPKLQQAPIIMMAHVREFLVSSARYFFEIQPFKKEHLDCLPLRI